MKAHTHSKFTEPTTWPLEEARFVVMQKSCGADQHLIQFTNWQASHLTTQPGCQSPTL